MLLQKNETSYCTSGMIKILPSSQRPNVKALQKQSLVMGTFSISKSVSKSDSAAQALLQTQNLRYRGRVYN